MGSIQSTSEENYNNNNATANSNLAENLDPWWPIENNENFTLEQPNLNETNIINSDTIDSNNSNNNCNNSSDLNIITKNINLEKGIIINSNKNLSEIELIEKHNNGDSSVLPSSSSSLNDVIAEDTTIDSCNNNNNNNLKPLECSTIKSLVPVITNCDKEQTLEEFKEELKNKRMARQTAIGDLRDEITNLRNQLANEREINRKLKNGEIIDNEKMIDVCVSTDDIDDYKNIITLENKEFENSLKDMVKQLQKDLAETHYNLQMTNSENITLNTEVGVLRKQVGSLKDVVSCSKQMIEVREEQVTQLKTKLHQIEESLADRETKLLSEDLRREYDRQMENIRNLRQLYEERARVCSAERENLLRQIQIKKDDLAAEVEKTKNLEERVANFEKEIQANQTTIEGKNSEYNVLKYENRELKEEMSAVNLLFSQMLLGFNGNNSLDIDRLTIMLEENRTLLNEIATKEADYEGASLPKLLFDIVKQANNDDDDIDNYLNRQPELSELKSLNDTVSTSSNDVDQSNTSTNVDENTASLPIKFVKSLNDGEQKSTVDTATFMNPLFSETISESLDDTKVEVKTITITNKEHDETNINLDHVEKKDLCLNEKIGPGKVVSAQEIIGNLPKVWRVIMEFLNHQKIEQVEFVENGQSEDCYKSVQTPNGPKAELSVSKTYIKLKNLILEKKSLVKETSRLKTLNSHLEYRLNEQEKRLSAVSLELQKTWHLVGKMQRQHRQLHTHEQILRYQLQQKRRLLSELKEELEYCRRKWAAARAKNMESQLQCEDMRKEFAKRRLEDSNNSAESGYSDGAGSGTDEDERISGDQQKRKIPPHKFVHNFIENSRILERRNSLSPLPHTIIETNLIRCQSAPAVDTAVTFLDKQIANNENLEFMEQEEEIAAGQSTSTGTIPKQNHNVTEHFEDDDKRTDRTERIQRLEEQCKSLIARVLETSECREKLELQIKRFQDEMPPAQHPVPLNELLQNTNTITKIEKNEPCSSGSNNMNVTESISGKGQLTEREEEYTRRRSERIQRLENESKQLMSKIKKTNDRGSTMVTRLKEIHARCINSREGSFDSSGDDECEKTQITTTTTKTVVEPPKPPKPPCTELDNEISMIGKCAERLKRLEKEGEMLLSKWTRNSERGTDIEKKLDNLHSRYAKKTGENQSKNDEEIGSSSGLSRSDSQKTVEERLKEVENKANSRDERLKQMEIDSKELLTKLNKTSNRGSNMIERLKEGTERRNSLRKEQEKFKKERKENMSSDEDETISKNDKKCKEEEIDTKHKEILQMRLAKLTGTKPKVKTLPQTGVGALTLSSGQNKLKDKISTEKQNDSDKESLEEMFLRLSGLSSTQSTSTNSNKSDENENSNDNSNNDSSPEKTDKNNDNQPSADKE